MPDKKPDDDLDDLLNLIDEDVPSGDAVESVDELLETAPVEAPAAPAPAAIQEEVPAAPVETSVDPDAAAKIAALEAELAAPVEKPKRARRTRPVPESKLTPEQKKIRELEDQLARKRAEQIENAEEEFETALDGDEVKTIHILEDGFTFAGRVWYRGQEVDFPIGGEAYEQTLDRDGNSWLDLADDEYAQIAFYGKLMFRKGPWPGKKPEQMSAQERQRQRSAPIV